MDVDSERGFYFYFYFLILYSANNTHYITVDDGKKKTEKKNKLQLSQDLIQLVGITNYKNTEYALHYCTYRYKTRGKEKFRDDDQIMQFSLVRERTNN